MMLCYHNPLSSTMFSEAPERDWEHSVRECGDTQGAM